MGTGWGSGGKGPRGLVPTTAVTVTYTLGAGGMGELGWHKRSPVLPHPARAGGYFQSLSNRGDLRSSPSPSTPWPEVAQGKWSSGQGGALGGRYRVHPGLEVGASLSHPFRKTNSWPRAAVSLSPRETPASRRASCSEKGADGVLGSCPYADSETLQDLGQVSAPL